MAQTTMTTRSSEVAGQTFDAVIVGSGASGGWAAKRLSEAGLRVCVLEAGRALSDADYQEHVPAFQLAYRDKAAELVLASRPQQGRSYAVMEWNADWFASDLAEPYTPYDNDFLWVRPRVVGGRTNVWGRQSYRLSDLDFKAASRDGEGVDWPIAYADLAPYYDQVEEYVGISGIPERLSVLPDGRFQPPMGLTCAEVALRSRLADRFGRTFTQGRAANLTRAVNGRQPCHYCGPCERGCVTHSYFNAAFTTVADALATGRCTLAAGTMAAQVLMDGGRNRARGVRFVDRDTRRVGEVYGHVVLLCAQTFESLRLLFNSKTRRHPAGLGNSSGLLGRYLMTHWSDSGASAEFAEFADTPRLGGPDRPTGMYIPRFRNIGGSTAEKGFLRGYGYQCYASRGIPYDRPGLGQAWKRALREPRPLRFAFEGFGEALPYEDNFCEIDASVVDAWGIPVVRIHLTPRENEIAMLRDMADAAAEMLEAAGGRDIRQTHGRGGVAHELGGARMGEDPKRSVLTPFQRLHDVGNVYVLDGSGFPSSAWQNPTLTLMSLAVRSCDHLLDQWKKGEA